MRSGLFTLTLLTMLVARPAFAVDKRLATQWNDSIAKTSTLLKEQKYAQALPILKRVASEMVATLGRGAAAANILGVVTVQRAIAEAGVGNSSDAVWYWHVALNLNPRFAESDLSAFGEPAVYLKQFQLRDLSVDEGGEECSSCQSPRLKRQVHPRYPTGAAFYTIQGELIVDVVVTRNGDTTKPRIIKPLPAASLSYAALEALKQWTFEPGRRNGEPVDFEFRLTINYRLR